MELKKKKREEERKRDNVSVGKGLIILNESIIAGWDMGCIFTSLLQFGHVMMKKLLK